MEFLLMFLGILTFVAIVTAINNAPKGYKAPSFENARTTLLDEVQTSVEKELILVKDTWYTDGVSIVSDGWSNVRKNPLINILAVNSHGAMFLYAEDYSGVEKSRINIVELLLETIDEVDPANAIQVVTDNAAISKLARKEVEKVHPHIFWSPCVVHTLNLIFKDLAQTFDWFTDTYNKGKKMVNYFVNHSHALTIFRLHSKLELLNVAKTRFASHFIMLKRLDVREALATTVVLNSWKELMKSDDEYTRDMGALITRYIGSDYFWDEVYNIEAITKPIYKLIRFCDKDGPLMGEIYERMDNMLGEIKDVYKNNKHSDAYTQIETIVLGRWEKMNVSMHCLEFSLSPQFYDYTYVSTLAPSGTMRKRPNEDKEVVVGVLKAFEKIASHPEEARMLHKQFVDFHMRKGVFSIAAAFVDASTMGAIEWWATYGSGALELAEVGRKAKCITSGQASVYSFQYSLLSQFQENFKEVPFKKWDVNPKDTMIDDSQVRLEGWQSLEDDKDDTQQEHSHLDERTQGQYTVFGSRFPRQSSGTLARTSNPAPQMRSQQSQISSFIRQDAASSSIKDKGKMLA
ncbi:hypothetical protein ACSBR1_020873 [Camellia fascicularis]